MTEIASFDTEIGAAATRVLGLEEDRELTGIKADDATRAVVAEISRLEQLKTPRLISDAVLGKTNPRTGKTGLLELQDIETLLDIERAKL